RFTPRLYILSSPVIRFLHFLQLLPIYLSSARYWHLLQLHPFSWHHVLRQPLLQILPYLTHLSLFSVLHHHISNQPLSYPLLLHHHRRLLHSSVPQHRPLYLSYLYPVSPHLYLMVPPSYVLYPPFQSIPHKISRPVQPLSFTSTVLVRHKLL